MLYDRVLTLCELDASVTPRCLRPKRNYYFGEGVVGVTRFYAAMQAGERVDMSAELWRAEIVAGQYCLVDGRQFRVVQAQHKLNADELPVTVLSLRLSETVFPVGEARP